MKLKNIVACIAGLLLASLSGANAASTLTAWTFDNLGVAANSSPQPSSGFGAASAVGLNNADVQALAGSSGGAANSWRVRGTGGSVWSTNAAIGSQGAKFAASTLGYYQIKISFDVFATPDAEANLMVQYTTDGTIWNNATISSVGTLGVIANNTATNSTVMGSYVVLTNNGTTGWNNQITVNLSGISGVDNNANFAVRIVNASTGTNCVNTTGAKYNDNSGSWTFDNVVIQGVSYDTVAGWTFESYGTTAFVPHPVPEFGSGTASSIGFDTTYHFSDGSVGSTNKPDVLANGIPFSSSGSAGQFVWRVRGQGPGNGWFTGAPIGSQGAEFAVSTVNYSNILVTFDMFFTSQSEAKMCVLYTTNNWVTTNNAATLAYGANPTFIVTNSAGPNFSPDTVAGTYFWQTVGQNFYNNLIVDFTGVPGVDNNPNFAFRIVNAAQNGDCVAYNGGSYNNSSGNTRFDNVTVGGTFNGLVPPAVAYDPNATVDRPFTNTFTDDAAWRAKITSILINGAALTNAAFTTNTAGQIIFNPTNSVLLQSSGVKNIVINALGYSSVKITQPLAAGVATKLAITTQPTAPAASGGTLIANPALAITDKYGNGTTNPYPNATVTATVGGSGGWTLGGSTIQPAVNGVATFSNLSATVNGSAAVSGAVITFTVTGYTNTANASTVTNFNSSAFNISAPPAPFTRGNLAVLQIDTVANNTTFSVIEIKPSASRQTTPVNIIPISATGTNALRLSSAGSCGRLTLSDDGTLISFVGFKDESSATPDETFVQDRAVGTLNYTNLFSKPFSYSSISFGGSQGRACATLDNVNWLVVDKGGLYINSLLWSVQNNVVVRTFGGIPYVQTQKTASGSPIPAVYALAMDNPGSINHAVPNNLITDPLAVDFYIVFSNTLYTLDQISATSGLINKYSLANDGSGNWVTNGTFAMGNGADSFFATTNGNGGVYLYYTTGGGGTAANSIIRLTDAAGYNAPINIISSNVIYTASATTSVKGLTFVPQQTAYATELTPPPILTTQTVATVSGSFSITNTPDDPAWRSAITSITVNGSLLANSAYATNTAGRLVFDPTQSTLLQTAGVKTIVISATGYSTNSIAQTLGAGAPAKLAVTTQPTAPVGNGGPLAVQPVVAVQDQYGNVISTANSNIVAQVGTGAWTIGGLTTKAAVAGIATFTNLTATSAAAVTGATIHFTTGNLTAADSTPGFTIPAPIKSNLGGVTLNAGKLAFAFTNATGLSFSVLATNDLTAPVATWPVVGQAVESPAGSGNYQYTNSAATNVLQFYILRQP
jgi:hypothetical protein